MNYAIEMLLYTPPKDCQNRNFYGYRLSSIFMLLLYYYVFNLDPWVSVETEY